MSLKEDLQRDTITHTGKTHADVGTETKAKQLQGKKDSKSQKRTKKGENTALIWTPNS